MDVVRYRITFDALDCGFFPNVSIVLGAEAMLAEIDWYTTLGCAVQKIEYRASIIGTWQLLGAVLS